MAPDIQTQINLEELYNKNQLLPRLRAEFSDLQVIDYCNDNDIPVAFAVDLMAQMVLHKRASASVLIGILGPKHFTGGPDTIPTTEQLQACADMLIKAAEHDLVDWSDFAQQFVMRIDVTQDVYDELERYQYPLPLVVEPAEVRTNRDTGYHSQGSRKGSIILRQNHHDDDVCLDHINRVNKTRITINSDTVAMIENKWRHLDRARDGELQEDYEKRVRAFKKYDRTARDVLTHLSMAGDVFYLTHRYDKRGRCYSQGYHVNPQGNDWNKAVIEFADTEIVQISKPLNQERNAA